MSSNTPVHGVEPREPNRLGGRPQGCGVGPGHVQGAGGLKSTAVTSAWGRSCATARAMAPLPVPRSTTRRETDLFPPCPVPTPPRFRCRGGGPACGHPPAAAGRRILCSPSGRATGTPSRRWAHSWAKLRLLGRGSAGPVSCGQQPGAAGPGWPSTWQQQHLRVNARQALRLRLEQARAAGAARAGRARH